MGYWVVILFGSNQKKSLSIPFMGYTINSIFIIISSASNFQFPLWDTHDYAVQILATKSALSIPFMGYSYNKIFISIC